MCKLQPTNALMLVHITQTEMKSIVHMVHSIIIVCGTLWRANKIQLDHGSEPGTGVSQTSTHQMFSFRIVFTQRCWTRSTWLAAFQYYLYVSGDSVSFTRVGHFYVICYYKSAVQKISEMEVCFIVILLGTTILKQ